MRMRMLPSLHMCDRYVRVMGMVNEDEDDLTTTFFFLQKSTSNGSQTQRIKVGFSFMCWFMLFELLSLFHVDNLWCISFLKCCK